MYTCSCPQFQHYYFCKHAIGLALYRKEVTVPVQFSTEPAGRRKAPAGPKVTKRGHCPTSCLKIGDFY